MANAGVEYMVSERVRIPTHLVILVGASRRFCRHFNLVSRQWSVVSRIRVAVQRSGKGKGSRSTDNGLLTTDDRGVNAERTTSPTEPSGV